uniref:Electron transfer flavoprotein alpha/beta-subunit N-terminal domain-containing protein n=1 Tax=Romanomermis culicivorax TaxID=13658 RepID=A0A915K0D9_ROMCU
ASSLQVRLRSTLILAEHSNEKLSPATLNTIKAASALGGDVSCLVLGEKCATISSALSSVEGVQKILIVENLAFRGLLPEPVTQAVLALHKQYNFSAILAPATAFGKNVAPRIAAKLNVSPISDIIQIKEPEVFVRALYAGNALCTVKSLDPVKVITVRPTAFEAAKVLGGSAKEEKITLPDIKNDMSEFIGQELTKSERPELTGARIVVSG